MIEIEISIIPFGDRARKSTLMRGEIINNMSHKQHPHMGNYDLMMENHQDDFQFHGELLDHDRAQGMWPLLKELIDQAYDQKMGIMKTPHVEFGGEGLS